MDWKITPPGSACSITIGTGIVDTPPGSVQGMQMVVSDINAARAELVESGVDGNGWSVQKIPDRS